MAKPDQKKNSQAKILMIPLLGALLFWVISNSQEADQGSTSYGFQSADSNQNRNDSRQASRKLRDVIWPDIALDSILSHNPFQKGIEIQVAQRGQGNFGGNSVELDSKIEVSVYLESENGITAIIDGQVVREGDSLSDGRYITKLTPEFALIGEN